MDTRQRLQRVVGSSSVYWVMVSVISRAARMSEVENLWLCERGGHMSGEVATTGRSFAHMLSLSHYFHYLIAPRYREL